MTFKISVRSWKMHNFCSFVLVVMFVEYISALKPKHFKAAGRNTAYDNVYKTDNELWIIQTKSASLCIISCMDHIDCRSVAFNTNDGRCQVYNRNFRNQIVGGVIENGWQHFDLTPVDHCAPGVITTTASDCSQVESQGHSCNGVYTIHPSPSLTVDVYCDLQTDDGSWTVFQKRLDGSVNFFLYWSNYKSGFGDPATEYWIGNDALYTLTQSGSNELLILMEDWDGVWKHARYSDFRINHETDKYRLTLSGYSGTAGDSLNHPIVPQSGQQFTTRDRDNDAFLYQCSPTHHQGGWWFKNCGRSDLNGYYYSSGVNAAASCHWYTFSGARISLRTIMMMVRKT